MNDDRVGAPKTPARRPNVWLFALGYFACYVPYGALTKALSSGALGPRISGLSLVPLSTITSAVAMMVTFTLLGWWKLASSRVVAGVRIPRPSLATFLSGLATGAIVVTTTLAYTFEGVSIPFVMLLMRGGVLLLAPIVDRLGGRRPKWFAWVALALSLAALSDALFARHDVGLPIACAADVALYLMGYFARLHFMGKLGKSTDAAKNARYFVEEQMVATPIATVGLAVLAATLSGAGGDALRAGFTSMWSSPAAPVIVLIGVLSQGTGVFGGLVLLDARDHTFCVPLNRASSVLAGVVAALALGLFGASAMPSRGELIGAGLLLVSVLVLSLGDRIHLRQRPSSPNAPPGVRSPAQ